MRISDWSSDVCSSDLCDLHLRRGHRGAAAVRHAEQRRQRCGHPSRLALGDIHVDETMLQRLETSDRLAELLARSEEHTSELQSLMRISYAVFCLKKKKHKTHNTTTEKNTPKTSTIKTNSKTYNNNRT